MLVDDIAERLAGSLRPEDGPSPAEPAPDHLRRWLDVREAVPWDEKADGAADGATTPSCDGAVKDIRAFDAAIDPARADGLLIALKLMRAGAARGATLDFELLRGWQRHVLGAPQPPPFRTLPAFAKDGRERYGIGPDTRARFDACLAGSAAAAGGASLPWRPAPHVPASMSASSTPSTTATAERPSSPSCSSSPAKGSRSTT